MKPEKLLFILKRKNNYSTMVDSNIGMSTGLYNSSHFMVEMLNQNGIESIISVVVDNNEIDREVTKHKPSHVIIEALWVIPSKFGVLCRLHPKVKWIIRLHSEIPFLANEGSALDWIGDYLDYDNVYIATNAPGITKELKEFTWYKFDRWDEKIKRKIIYLPNYYPQDYKDKDYIRGKEYIDISCFGAIRPMKNHLLQAIAAIRFADTIGKKLRFHINSGRIEQNGDPVYKNLMSLFSHVYDSGHRLVRHEWCPREEFLKICEKMDIGMQVSFSETFNIVAADLVSQGVPVIASSELPWINPIYTAKPTKSGKIYRALLLTYLFPKINTLSNQYLLKRYTDKSKKIWIDYFKNKK
jgi:hypothetical protein